MQRRASPVPAHFPAFAQRLSELYLAGTTATFLLHGNVHDLVELEPGRYGSLEDFLSLQLFGQYELVIGYDLARGLHALGGSSERQREMIALMTRRLGDPERLPRDPAAALRLLDEMVLRELLREPTDRKRIAVIFEHAAFLVPNAERSQVAQAPQLVTLLNWAASPYVKRSELCFVLIDERASDFHERLASSPHVASIDVPLPEPAERQRYLESLGDLSSWSIYDAATLAKLTAGCALTDLEVLVRGARDSGQPLDEKRFKARKKVLIERQAQGLLEFIEPKFGLEMVVGHEAAKRRLLADATLIRQGHLDVAPMGYLFNGPVGTGKTFLATCLAGSIGMPCVKLKNFRSKYVGETEGNLERVLGVLRSMGPVMVIIDEADAMLGDRDQGGDSGVGARVFGMIANAMGDTEYRGKIVWMLLTARPDLLPVDIKRQGRAEIHVPLFYPQTQEEVRQYFVILAKKLGATLAESDVPEVPHLGNLSGADIESIVGRTWRMALLEGKTAIDRPLLEQALADFMPSTQTLERELQEIAAIVECTDREFLIPAALEKLERWGGREGLQRRFNELSTLL
jgi:AAA+ superfamily predicted ATPase